MRSGCEIEEKYAGEYARPLAHADTRVMIHPSAASAERPAGSYIISPLGWYDAGDYNKYIVNSAYSVAVMLSFPFHCRSIHNRTEPQLLRCSQHQYSRE